MLDIVFLLLLFGPCVEFTFFDILANKVTKLLKNMFFYCILLINNTSASVKLGLSNIVIISHISKMDVYHHMAQNLKQ